MAFTALKEVRATDRKYLGAEQLQTLIQTDGRWGEDRITHLAESIYCVLLVVDWCDHSHDWPMYLPLLHQWSYFEVYVVLGLWMLLLLEEITFRSLFFSQYEPQSRVLLDWCAAGIRTQKKQLSFLYLRNSINQLSFSCAFLLKLYQMCCFRVQNMSFHASADTSNLLVGFSSCAVWEELYHVHTQWTVTNNSLLLSSWTVPRPSLAHLVRKDNMGITEPWREQQ